MPKQKISLAPAGDAAGKNLVVVVDDDPIVAAAFVDMLEHAGFRAACFGSAEALLHTDWADHAVCLLLDESLPGISGVEALAQLIAAGSRVPVVMITGSGDVPTAVRAMKAGACDFIEKPASATTILAAVDRALALSGNASTFDGLQADSQKFTTQLTARQRQILDLVIAGQPNKNIAADLGISQRTVENHRAIIMRKSGVKSLPALARMMFVTSLTPPAADAVEPDAADLNELERDRFERFFEQIPLAVIIASLSPADRIIYANPAFEALSGQNRADIEGQPWTSLQGTSVGPGRAMSIGDAVTGASELVGTFRIERPDGGAALADVFSSVITGDDDGPAFRLAALVDVGSRDAVRMQEFELQIREKDMRLLEIQHRVKNNLQMITALVRVEARKAQGQPDRQLFDRLAGRINSIQLVYKLLSEGSHGEEIDLGVYLSDVASSIMHASAMDGIGLDLRVDSYPVSVNVALPTGMVVNEVMTNALKHAFAGRDTGTITLHSLSDERGRRVVVADDGIGLPEGVTWPKRGKLSALIVQSLCQNANATIAVDSKPGHGMLVTITY